MAILILFAFLGGIVTILSPCILPILPIVLGSGTTGGKRKPLGVIAGFVLSFTFFTLFLTSLVRATGLPADSLRIAAAIVILLFGLVLVIPHLNSWWEKLTSKLTNLGPARTSGDGFVAGLVIGVSLGLIWTPCVGPILAAIISLAITGSVTASAIPVVLAYALGTAIPLFLILIGLRKFIPTWPWLQKAFGLLMILAALAIYLNLDRQFQAFVLDKFPNYGANLTKLEDNALVKQQLQDMTEEVKSPGKTAPELDGGTRWLNSQPLTLAGLRGRVVLIDFWTYSCINCIRTLPYLTAWDDKYKDKGLTIVGVHSPEFEFEKNPQNVLSAMKDFGINYPVVQDNDFVIWRAYQNRYWPAKYLIDKEGVIRYTHFGEGAYDQTEKKIQELLGETAGLVALPEYQSQTRTLETYLGSLRAIPNNPIYSLSGNWLTTAEFIQGQTGSSLKLTFDAKEVNLVAKPANGQASLELLLDGQALKPVIVNEDKLYNLVKLIIPGRHELIITLTGPLQLFAFTFG